MSHQNCQCFRQFVSIKHSKRVKSPMVNYIFFRKQFLCKKENKKTCLQRIDSVQYSHVNRSASNTCDFFLMHVMWYDRTQFVQNKCVPIAWHLKQYLSHWPWNRYEFCSFFIKKRKIVNCVEKKNLAFFGKKITYVNCRFEFFYLRCIVKRLSSQLSLFRRHFVFECSLIHLEFGTDLH